MTKEVMFNLNQSYSEGLSPLPGTKTTVAAMLCMENAGGSRATSYPRGVALAEQTRAARAAGRILSE